LEYLNTISAVSHHIDGFFVGASYVEKENNRQAEVQKTPPLRLEPKRWRPAWENGRKLIIKNYCLYCEHRTLRKTRKTRKTALNGSNGNYFECRMGAPEAYSHAIGITRQIR
jgi:hypothetical protein